MSRKLEDIQLKFDGKSIQRLDGAPAETLIASLNALQRMVFIIGMRSEGRALSQRLKPTAKVKREYAVVCRAPRHGSHIQPFNVTSQTGVFSPAASAAREKLLKALKAFDSGDEAIVERALPNARERWFLADAAAGLLPPEDSGIEIALRSGSHGPFSFKGDRARPLLEKYKKGSPPDVDEDTVVGKLRAIDYGQTILTIKPSHSPAIRMDYPLPFENWLQSNVRRRLQIVGQPKFNQMGDISSFKQLSYVTELEPTLDPILEFLAAGQRIEALQPLFIPATLNWQDRIFEFRDPSLGIDAYSENINDLRKSVLEELDVLWRHYALSPDDELDTQARAVKAALHSRFRSVGA